MNCCLESIVLHRCWTGGGWGLIKERRDYNTWTIIWMSSRFGSTGAPAPIEGSSSTAWCSKR